MLRRTKMILAAWLAVCLAASANAQVSEAVDNTARQGVGSLITQVQDLQAAVDALQVQLDAEVAARGAGDSQLQNQIDALNLSIAGLQSQIDALGLAPRTKTVFVSSVHYTGDLGGISGADAKCNALAAAAGLTGTFKTWVSATSGGAPSLRYTKESVPYVLTDGSVVAESWDGLTDGLIDHVIDLDEWGSPTTAIEVWSNTREDGSLFGIGSPPTCSSWTSSALGDRGETGFIPRLDGEWTAFNDQTCDVMLPIYCFEQ